jgi:hypothetical protein
MVEQCRLFSSVEYPSGQLGEVCFESLVGCSLWVDHREMTARSSVRDGCFVVTRLGGNATEQSRRRGEGAQWDLLATPVRGVRVFLSRCSSQIPVVSR